LILLLVSRKVVCPFIASILLSVFLLYHPCNAKDTEDTYNISLVKTAEPVKEGATIDLDGKKIVTETYTVKEGDHIWKVLREKNLLENKNLQELINTLKQLNSSLSNIDMIRPGEKIVIPLVITPVAGISARAGKTPAETIPISAIKDLDLADYIVKEGDSVIKVVEDLYEIPAKDLYNEYLSKLKEINPDIKDINSVHPGQRIKLPIYSPKAVRLPIKADRQETMPATEMTDLQKEDLKAVSGDLKQLFTLMGEQWVDSGEHFFPLKTGGQLKLNAASYPVVDLKSGKKVIVDLYGEMPGRMGDLITSNWDDYSIIHLSGADSLKKAFDMIAAVCGYKRVYSSGEPFVMGGNISFTITADRIIDQGVSDKVRRIVAINFIDKADAGTPGFIRTYLETVGVKVIDYPVPASTGEPVIRDILGEDENGYALIETVLTLTGQDYEKRVQLPVYENRKADLNLMIDADFSVNIGDKVRIIDLNGMGKDIVSLLKEHQFTVYSILTSQAPFDILKGLFDFLGIAYEAGSQRFLSKNGTESRNVLLDIQGITFKDANLKDVFATSLRLPEGVILLLNQKGYRVLQLPDAFAIKE
jgi:hypothetical protein